VGIHLRILLSLVRETWHSTGTTTSIGIYLKIGIAVRPQRASYLVDYFHFQGYLRWFLIIVFMLLKAG